MSLRILAIDTATESCSVAVWNEGVVASRFEISPREHTQKILPMVKSALEEANITLQSLDALAFGRGPGSFTGVRIGVGVAQGIALGAELSMIGISSLATMAEGVFRTTGIKQVLVAIDARMGEIYCAQYQRNDEGVWIGEDTEAVMKPEQFIEALQLTTGTWAMAGTGWQAYPDLKEALPFTVVETEITLPVAQDMLPLAVTAWHEGKATKVEDAEPVYLRNEVTWKKLPGRE
ncbi:tRNA (adenosine(37)-N6)-threonylcarbamoyltransferase complex dimerization subunit type 1 TsaB [Proteus terrae]|uniref:tRNA threonylcarbamoyladenosine biosynthesis protein TsaB n=1 Tax=Proteus terrae subsp. cibarius TaxID=626774 RepID=A0ABX6JKR1_9GAMM|nr:tRNA (adenosine(37)-N6)-threonylcarbamoyltransferase complex dimerization subunit type 1 TsaB [Proteus terrae]QGW03295.1 tRNA (adenosine(37)-N6)-threonylcarbamoyltransferase complex dimerization subunit type 1 TsaB [Proteus terrae subsp. cibarius]QIF89694.1 tRNA (adenosine(37)-N6)-threonylcarbamoyltransferase complex dimerization subunit type 1 TsaB [Proteus terrae subsp. cibarius]QIF98198.1 tRNA (adenosine(37)-N6)-threonylcarbamoyltransferase complex dimerization subunit type 1 TsaB [Proteus